ncbi:hypothetical protein [Geothrix sp. PMB-07]|uniref:hypothetical protein n=1 Tax=Geothrix sp. PMB-07 TaxID=3068640 RepID=UPI002741E7BA|nr:hypothetical protein [Geothrix sp. PMB-07]WLT32904.1 hypothetical protein Q9293_06115 [Geothrix sp. PMB-07]
MRSPLLMLMPAILMAQRSALPPQEAFNRELKQNRLGTWLVVEDDGAAWGAAVRTALDDDSLVQLNLPLKVSSGGKKPDGLSPILRDRYNWPKGAHWALVDGKGRILVEGASQPTVPILVAAAEQAGVKSRTQELETFLRQNPDHLEARSALLGELMAVANRRTNRALAGAATSKDKPAGTTAEAPEPIRLLEPDQDETFWSAAVQQMDQILQSRWESVGMELGVRLRSSAAEHSPSMVALLNRYRSDLEEAVRRRPNGVEAWMLWLQASQKCGGWPLVQLLQTVQPLPGTSPGDWPPSMALSEFVKDARARKDWPAIREVMEARWEDVRAGEYRWGGGEMIWNRMISPLMEALVSLGDVGAADQLMNEVMGMEAWSGLSAQARDLATRLNRPDLAARWGALSAKGR